MTESEGRRYRVLEALGRGGFGTVYRAELQSTGGFSKAVALKVLNPDVEGVDDIVQRLRDEARMLGLLRHRAIVQVDGLVRLDGRWVVVMEYVEGVSLAELVKQYGRVPPKIALAACAEVAGALDVAFARPTQNGQPLGLLHRDIKPANVQLTPNGEVKLLDFGVARADFGSREAKTRSVMFGSIPYMAPERFEFEDGHAADVYALAATLFELIVAQPFGQASPNPPKHEERIEAGLARLNAIAPDRELRAFLAQGLAFEPTARMDARTFERRAEELAARMDGPRLKDWAEHVVPPILAGRVREKDELTDQILSESAAMSVGRSGDAPSVVKGAEIAAANAAGPSGGPAPAGATFRSVGLRRGLDAPPVLGAPPIGVEIVRASLDCGDVDAAEAWFASLGDPDRRAEAVRQLGLDTKGKPAWVDAWVQKHPKSASARLVRGAWGTAWAWEARSGRPADQVGYDAMKAFQQRLAQADEDLAAAAVLAPEDATPWVFQLVTARGRQLPSTDAARRFDEAFRRAPLSPLAHHWRLVALTAKWGGTHDAMFAFARRASTSAPEAHPLHAIVAEAHLERWLYALMTKDAVAGQGWYRRQEVRDELLSAARRSVLSPQWPEDDALWVRELNLWAFTFWKMGEHGLAKRMFDRLGGLCTSEPWDFVGPPLDVYRETRKEAIAKAVDVSADAVAAGAAKVAAGAAKLGAGSGSGAGGGSRSAQGSLGAGMLPAAAPPSSGGSLLRGILIGFGVLLVAVVGGSVLSMVGCCGGCGTLMAVMDATPDQVNEARAAVALNTPNDPNRAALDALLDQSERDIPTGRLSLWEYSQFKVEVDNVVEDGQITQIELDRLNKQYRDMMAD